MNMSRIQSIDNAKGIGIILVVIGHSVDVFSAIGVSISSFHMPLFFILSGFLFNENIKSLINNGNEKIIDIIEFTNSTLNCYNIE